MFVPLIMMLSTVNAVSVPKDVTLACAAVCSVPVKSPLIGPANASAVTVPSKYASLNSAELVPKSTSLSVAGTKAPSTSFIWCAFAA